MFTELFLEGRFDKKPLDKDLVLAFLKVKIDSNSVVNQKTYLSNLEIDMIKERYGKRLPKGFKDGLMIGYLLSSLIGGKWYMDGNTLINIDRSIMKISDSTTWAEVAHRLHINI